MNEERRCPTYSYGDIVRLLDKQQEQLDDALGKLCCAIPHSYLTEQEREMLQDAARRIGEAQVDVRIVRHILWGEWSVETCTDSAKPKDDKGRRRMKAVLKEEEE